MRRVKVPGPLEFTLVCLFLFASAPFRQGLQAQTAPGAGTTVVVRMTDAVDSGSDPAGKQYRATVTKPVNADNGATIAQGAAATVTLAKNGSSWGAQLSSVVINGQVVAVTSSSANVTSAAQSAAGSAANAVGSVLGGFGHHTNVPASVPAVATGQRVMLPPGTTLNFVLAAAAPASASPSAANVSSSASAAPAVNAASAPSAATAPTSSAATASGRGSWYQCRSWGENGAHQTVYVTPFIQTDAAASTINQAFYNYMHSTYPVDKLAHGSDFCRAASADPGQRTFQLSSQEKQWAASNPPWEVIHINWTYTPVQAAASTAAAVASAAPTAAANENYVLCSSDPDQQVVYFSEIFAAEMPARTGGGPGNGGAQRNASNKLQSAFLAFLQKQYSFKSGSNYPIGCAATFMPTAAGLHAAQMRKQQMEDQYKQAKKQVVETGWKNQ
ncbi:MAG: hypothetical protein WDN23_17595 [Edaphobacter sp.]